MSAVIGSEVSIKQNKSKNSSERTVRNDLLPKPLSRGILDGQLLSHFALQPVHRQKEMMRQIGTDEVTVASDLQALGGFW